MFTTITRIRTRTATRTATITGAASATRVIRRIAALAAAFAVTAIAAADPPSFEPGTAAPDIVLPDAVTGEPRSLAEFRGRRIVLHVFASW